MTFLFFTYFFLNTLFTTHFIKKNFAAKGKSIKMPLQMSRLKKVVKL